MRPTYASRVVAREEAAAAKYTKQATLKLLMHTAPAASTAADERSCPKCWHGSRERASPSEERGESSRSVCRSSPEACWKTRPRGFPLCVLTLWPITPWEMLHFQSDEQGRTALIKPKTKSFRQLAFKNRCCFWYLTNKAIASSSDCKCITLMLVEAGGHDQRCILFLDNFALSP